MPNGGIRIVKKSCVAYDKKVSEKIGEDRQGQALYRTIGQELNSCAWWENT